ncbi:MAG TPA: DUF6600 domain-containing protein [Candidatus Krumholzibacteria bacterium]|nr:DUF6600 domain-containing protein [Candidatus Krumholzibacteria bacterium]
MMRHSWVIFSLSLTLAACGGYDRELMGDPVPEPAQVAAAEVTYEETEEVPVEPADSLAMFDDLRFYGSWYELYPYGMVWRPVVVSTWAPMSYGHWVWTSYGWMWVSYDPFGSLVYQYGFWVNDFALGWVWVPDYVWAPVQCEWVWWDDYIGWCPLPPPGVRYKDPWEYTDSDPWITVRVTKFKETDVAHYKTTPKFKSGYSERTLRREAPDAGTIERGLGRPVRVVDVQIDKIAVGQHELTRVVLPHDEQRIIEKERASRPGGAVRPSPEARFKQPPPNSGGTGSDRTKDEVSPPPKEKATTTPPPKEKSTSSPPPKKESPPKFKEKDKEKDSSSDKKDGEKKKG